MGWHDQHTLQSILRFTIRAATRPQHRSVDLRTRFLVMDLPTAWRHVQTCIERLGRPWRIDEETPASRTFHLVRKARLRFFWEDVKVSLWPADDRRVGVDAISTSRAGRIDFGQNARNIREFYRALEAYLQCLPSLDAGCDAGIPGRLRKWQRHAEGAPNVL